MATRRTSAILSSQNPSFNYGEAFDNFVSAATPLVAMIENNRQREHEFQLATVQSDMQRTAQGYAERISDNQRVLDTMRLETQARNDEWRQYIELQTHIGDMEMKRQAAELQSAQFKMQREVFDKQMEEADANKKFSAMFTPAKILAATDRIDGAINMERVLADPIASKISPNVLADATRDFETILNTTKDYNYFLGREVSTAETIRSIRSSGADSIAGMLWSVKKNSPSIMTNPKLLAALVPENLQPYVAAYMSDLAATYPNPELHAKISEELRNAQLEKSQAEVEAVKNNIKPEESGRYREAKRVVDNLSAQASGGVGDTLGLHGDPIKWGHNPTLDVGVLVRNVVPRAQQMLATLPANDPRRPALTSIVDGADDIVSNLVSVSAQLRSIKASDTNPDGSIKYTRENVKEIANVWFPTKGTETSVTASLGKLNDALGVLNLPPITPEQLAPKEAIIAVYSGLKNAANDGVFTEKLRKAGDFPSLVMLKTIAPDSSVKTIVNRSFNNKLRLSIAAIENSSADKKDDVDKGLQPWWGNVLDSVKDNAATMRLLTAVTPADLAVGYLGYAVPKGMKGVEVITGTTPEERLENTLRKGQILGSAIEAAIAARDFGSAKKLSYKLVSLTNKVNEKFKGYKEYEPWVAGDFIIPKELQYNNRSASDIRSEVYGILGMSTSGNNTPNYGTIEPTTTVVDRVLIPVAGRQVTYGEWEAIARSKNPKATPEDIKAVWDTYKAKTVSQ